MEQRLADELLDSIRDSMRRSRWLLSVVSFVCTAILVAEWNVYCSWLQSFTRPGALEAQTGLLHDQQQHLLNTWVESGFMNATLLGIKVHISDASFLAALGLGTLTLCLFYAMRRENHLSVSTLRRAFNAEQPVQDYLYYGIHAHNVFATMTDDDRAMSTLDKGLTDGAELQISERYRDRLKGVRGAFTALFFLPFSVILSLVVLDLMSLFLWQSPFRREPILWNCLGPSERVKVVVMSLVGIASAVYCFAFANYCRLYQSGTIEVLKEFKREVIEKRSARKP